MFVALDLPADARERLVEWRDRLVAGRSDLRPVRPEALHVTLVFLGWQDESAAERIAEATFGAGEGIAAPRLKATRVRPLPPRDPRLFALDLDDEDARASELQAAVSEALEAGRWYRPEKRPFWPHMTLARVKSGPTRPRRVAGLGDDRPPPQVFEAGELTLYRSTLRPQGALYEPLARRRL
jgi:RNA 2',3'-cyclic 3'-phosphodiesterase